MSATKMNSFLQRMLRKNSNEELNTIHPLLDKQSPKPEPEKASPTKGNWIRKLGGNCSPTKHEVPGSSPARMTRLKHTDTGLLCESNQATSPRGISRTSSSNSIGNRSNEDSSTTPLEMPDLESIIRDFEMGFLSPSKNGASKTVDASKQQQKNFVKKIVAAFEVKYKTYNDLKTCQEAREAEETSRKIESFETKRRSSLFASPFRSGSEQFRNRCKNDDVPKNSPEKIDRRRSCVFFTPTKYSVEDSTAFGRSGEYVSPLKASDDEESRRNPSNESKDPEEGSVYATPSKRRTEESRNNARRSGIFSSPFDRSKDSCESDAYSSPVRFECQDSKDSSSDSSSLFKFDKEESRRRSDVPCVVSPAGTCSLDDTKTLESIDLDVTLPEPDETIFLDAHALCKTSTKIVVNARDRPIQASISRTDKTPKIVGAFLKKPIEVEDTSIEWIPITGKKLPRKRSLKKLLTSWTTKRSFDKKNSLFSSERNLNEETRELQDSGYDEKSCSSSSLTSLISITEALLLQENSYVEPDRRTTFGTFRSKESLDEESDETFQNVGKRAKKLLLTEVPREQVKVDLGPIYPCPKVLTKSLDRKTTVAKKSSATSPGTTMPSLPRIPKHPHLSSIPKHPFVSLTKLDDGDAEGSPLIVKNSLYEVEFRKSCTDVDPANDSRDSSASSDTDYDVPRRYLSKSETHIPQACRVEFRRLGDIAYDVPRTPCRARPRSSVYEDALSIQRKSSRIGEQRRPMFEFYSCFSDTEPHYATVKPRHNRMLQHGRETLLNSVQDVASIDGMYEF